MKASEILRKLADMIDGKEGDDSIAHQPNSAEMHPVDVNHQENPEINTKSMVGPLQQKLDLMKRLAGEEVCHDCGQSACECEPEHDDLATMKKNAGLAPVIMAIADEDAPFEG